MPQLSALNFPPPLKSGGTVGLVAPARWPQPEWIEMTKAMLARRGYRVATHPQTALRDGQLAGSDAARIGALHDMFADPAIDAVLCVRGGTGSTRLLDGLDYGLIARNPKPFVGFSDITALLQAITQRCGFVTFHGPLGWNFAQPDCDPRTEAELFAMLGPQPAARVLRLPEVETARAGEAEGVLTGGNITLLQYLIGTPYDWSGDGAILFIEDVDEALYKIDAKLRQFSMAGKFRHVRAVLVGAMVDIVDGETGLMRSGEQPYGRDLRQIVMEHVPPHIPLAFNFPCGHAPYITTLPVGARVRLRLDQRGGELRFQTDIL